MNCSRFGILIFFSSSVVLSRITHILFATTSNSRLSISIALPCVFAIACTYVNYCTSTYTFVDGCTCASTTFSSLASFYTSTKCYSVVSFSPNSSMNIGSTNVAPSLIYFLTHQCLLLLCKNSTIDVLVVPISWIIVYANCIFSLYTFPSTYSKDDDECDDDLTTNSWIFNTPSCSTILNSSFAFIFLNDFASSCLRLCSIFYTSFSFSTFLYAFYSFSIIPFAFMLM